MHEPAVCPQKDLAKSVLSFMRMHHINSIGKDWPADSKLFSIRTVSVYMHTDNVDTLLHEITP